MIRIGKSYGNLMVDMRASNVKLQDRAERIANYRKTIATRPARAEVVPVAGFLALADAWLAAR